MRPIRIALLGAGVALSAGIAFMLGDGLLRASAFMIGLATVPVVLGVLLASYFDHPNSIRGRMPALGRVLDRSRFLHSQRAACSLCRQPLDTSRGIRICPDCDLTQIAL